MEIGQKLMGERAEDTWGEGRGYLEREHKLTVERT